MRRIPAAGVKGRQVSQLRAFTLVELLVVIGIIALLVSILLPALNHARQQANLLVCQTHLRQIGQGIDLYADDYKGTLPFGYWSGTPSNFATGPGGCDWSTLLTYELSSRLGSTYDEQGNTGGYKSFNRGVFLDVDTIPGGDGALHYSSNPRLMPNLDTPLPGDGTSYEGCVPYKIAHIQRSSEIVLIMDGTQSKYNGNPTNGGPSDENYWGAYSTAYAIDGWKLQGLGHEFVADYLLFNDATDNGVSINPGLNVDNGSGTKESGPELPDGDIRWRHMNNKAANFLYVDGHVEAHYIKPNPGGANLKPPQYYTTDLLGKNINVNP